MRDVGLEEGRSAPFAAAPGCAPDFAEPLVGWRAWIVVADGGYLWLESLLYATRWAPRRSLDAVCVPHRRCYLCARGGHESGLAHPAPAEDCHCGIYAAAEPGTLAPYLESGYPGRLAVGHALGRVLLWGKVVECERGWRAGRAYPERIYLPAGLPTKHRRWTSRRIAGGLEDYGVPIILLRGRTPPEVIASVEEAAA